MCESLAEGGRRCLDFDRLTSHDIDHFAPAPTDGIEDVDWRSDGDAMQRTKRYRKEAACWSLTLLEEVREEEPAVTSAVRSAADSAGGRCYGLAFRMKSPDSLARKLDNEMEAADSQGGGPIDAEGIARREADDALRYTVALEGHDELPAGLERTIDSLRAQGWEPVEVKDSFLSGNSYKGLHVIARTPTGRVVEVQVHSERSVGVKEDIHVDYEVARDLTRPRAERRAAALRCIEISRGVESPAGLAGYYPAGGEDDGRAKGQVRGVPIRKKAYTRDEGGVR